ncbi:DoxX family protein [Chondrinema litorale]|uniref:DoxX family protein n=1 Tax=Chondrinema litorale TaxID=2994555 RepID=UPI002543D291|nr:DoxX family protein [Chondrinema litorale]UZR96902.1 DoxX family protein [Chondrinema litorale]
MIQVLLAISLIWSAFLKFITPIEELSEMWFWVGEVPIYLVKFTGLIDLLGALGLILPNFINAKPLLTPLAAIGIILLMICAAIFHILRGEVSDIGVNIIFAFLAAFVAWGRMKN